MAKDTEVYINHKVVEASNTSSCPGAQAQEEEQANKVRSFPLSAIFSTEYDV
jgi:hypothetical protein